MLEYDRIYISEGTDTNKTNDWCDCIIHHYWYFLGINFRFQPKVCDGCHDMMQRFVSFNDFPDVTIGRNDCRIHLWFMTTREALG